MPKNSYKIDGYERSGRIDGDYIKMMKPLFYTLAPLIAFGLGRLLLPESPIDNPNTSKVFSHALLLLGGELVGHLKTNKEDGLFNQITTLAGLGITSLAGAVSPNTLSPSLLIPYPIGLIDAAFNHIGVKIVGGLIILPFKFALGVASRHHYENKHGIR